MAASTIGLVTFFPRTCAFSVSLEYYRNVGALLFDLPACFVALNSATWIFHVLKATRSSV